MGSAEKCKAFARAARCLVNAEQKPRIGSYVPYFGVSGLVSTSNGRRCDCYYAFLVVTTLWHFLDAGLGVLGEELFL